MFVSNFQCKRTSMTLVCNPKRICDHTLQNHQSQIANTIYYRILKIHRQRIASWVLAHVARVASLCNPGHVWRHTMHWISEQSESESLRSLGIPTACWAASAKAATWVGSDLSEIVEQILKYHDNTIGKGCKGNIWAKWGIGSAVVVTVPVWFKCCWGFPLSTIEASSGRDSRVRRP